MTRRVNRLERLARHEEKNIIKRIFFLTVFSAVIIFILFTVGISILGRLADFSDSIFKDKVDPTSSELEAPILSEIPEFTNQKNIKVSGFASSGIRVEIYLGGEKAGEAQIENGLFNFEDLALGEGENEITVKAFDDGVESDFSQSRTVTFDDEEPKLEITTPSPDQEFTGNNRVKIEGQTEKDAQVFAGGFLANVNADGKFEVVYPLIEGDNEIEVKAQDEAGNSTVEKIKVRFRK